MRAPLPHIVAVGVFYLAIEFDLFYNGEVVGKCQVEQQGMFYRINCCCKLPSDEKYYLWFCEHRLGLCTPNDSECQLTVRIPVRKLDISNGKFLIKPNKDSRKHYYLDRVEEMIPIIHNLPSLRLCKVDGRIAVYITECQAPGLPDSGQTP